MSLLRTIQNWREVQLAYMPQVTSFIPSTAVPVEAEKVPLYLPSSLPPQIRNQAELHDICDKERWLWEAQANNSLAHIRCLCRVIQGMWQFKKFSIFGTGSRPNTCMLATYHSLDNIYGSMPMYTALHMQPCRYLTLVACGLIV